MLVSLVTIETVDRMRIQGGKGMIVRKIETAVGKVDTTIASREKRRYMLINKFIEVENNTLSIISVVEIRTFLPMCNNPS